MICMGTGKKELKYDFRLRKMLVIFSFFTHVIDKMAKSIIYIWCRDVLCVSTEYLLYFR